MYLMNYIIITNIFKLLIWIFNISQVGIHKVISKIEKSIAVWNVKFYSHYEKEFVSFRKLY